MYKVAQIILLACHLAAVFCCRNKIESLTKTLAQLRKERTQQDNRVAAQEQG